MHQYGQWYMTDVPVTYIFILEMVGSCAVKNGQFRNVQPVLRGPRPHSTAAAPRASVVPSHAKTDTDNQNSQLKKQKSSLLVKLQTC